eukprot:Opistho-2@67562
MKKILVPIDFTDTAENAFVYALEMAKFYNAELLLLHTFDMPYVDNEILVFNYAEIYENLEVSNSNQFDEELKKLYDLAKDHDANNITINHIMMAGNLIENIKLAVQQENIDFVVMGTNGASGWFDSLVGTYTSEVISDLSVPVMSVAHDAQFEKMDTIAFTTRYKEKDILALEEVLAIAKRINAQVKCLYVKTSDSEVSKDTFSIWESHFKNHKNLEFFIIPSDDESQTIEEFLVNHNIDLLAMVTYKRSFFANFFTTSTTQKMSLHLKTPVLALHE